MISNNIIIRGGSEMKFTNKTAFLITACGGPSQSDPKDVAEHVVSLANKMSKKGMSQDDIADNIKTYWRNEQSGVGDFSKWEQLQKISEKHNLGFTFKLGKIKEVDLSLMYNREKDGDDRILYTFSCDIEKDGVIKDKGEDDGIIVIDKNKKDGKWYVGTIYHPNY